VIALTERDELRERQDALRAEHKDSERRIARLTTVLETDKGAGVASIVATPRVLEQRKAALRFLGCGSLRGFGRQAIVNWYRAMDGDGRTMLRELARRPSGGTEMSADPAVAESSRLD
jgi:hypothetical protein